MSEDQIGIAIKDAYCFLKLIYADVSHLLQIVDDRMCYHEMTALMGSRSSWGRSNSWSGDAGWITHYLARLYIPATQKPIKPSIKSNAVFFNVYFQPECLSQPIVVYGVIRHPGIGIDRDVLPAVKNLLALNSGPKFVTRERVRHWDSYADSESFHLFFNVQPLTDLNDKMSVDNVCDHILECYNILSESETENRYLVEEAEVEKIL